MRLFSTGAPALLCVGFMIRLSAIVAAKPPSADELSPRVDEYMAARVERDKFSGTILIARAGQVTFCKGYGLANMELDVPCAPTTKFRLGSLTKQFTAMDILILQERGKLNVTDHVKKYIPDAPKAWDDLTIHHLLTHTAGIPNYTSFPDFLKTLRDPVTPRRLIAKFQEKPLEFKPGEKFAYSNSGYIVLGQIIETASGMSYAAFVKEAIFDPLKMHDSGYDSAAQIIKNRASGYTRLLGVAPVNATYIDMSIPYAAGALYSTVLDLVKWDHALDTASLVSKKSLDLMFTPIKNGYGYGWNIGRKFGKPRYSHAGGIPGFVTIIERFPDEKLLVVGLCNLETPRIGAIGDDLGAIALAEPYVVPREPKPFHVDARTLESYVGSYEAELAAGKGKRQFVVSAADGRLTVAPEGLPTLEAVPESETRFYLKPVDGLADFIRAAGEPAGSLEMLIGNQKIRAKRLASPTAARNGAQAAPSEGGTSPKPSKVPASDHKQ